MLKKRIVGVITVRDGWAVQSFGYAHYLPLGHPEILAENLDRWGADEIIVLSIDRTRRGLGPDLMLLRRISALGMSTPLTFGGGIRTAAEASTVIQSGADRICVDAALWREPSAVREMAALLGSQAVIGVLPIHIDGGMQWHDHVTRTDRPLSELDLSLFNEQVVSEALIVDWRNEGRPNGFDVTLVRRFPAGVPLILFGGISTSEQIAALLAEPRVVACGVGNFLSYREHAVQSLRRGIATQTIRRAEFRRDA